MPRSSLAALVRVLLTCTLFASACSTSLETSGSGSPDTASAGTDSSDGASSEADSATSEATDTGGTGDRGDRGSRQIAEEEPGPRVVQLGTAAGRRDGQTPIDALVTVETVAGRQLDILRSYAFWDSDFPTLRQQWASDNGRELHVSINARREDGTVVPWETIATAAPGSQVHDELTMWVRRIAEFDRPLRVTFHHEADIEPEFGTPAEFIAAWQRIADLLAEEAPDVPLVWVMTLFTINQPDVAEQFWPGDGYVDWIAADAFNWFGCRGTPEPWRSPDLLLDPLIRFGQAHPGKPLMFAEIGSDEDPDDPGRKAAWFGELADLVERDEYAAIESIVFFHNDHDADSTCDWWLDSSTESADAFAEFAARDLFGGASAGPAPSQCPVVSTTLGRPDDRAVVDGDGDGRYDFVFGAENRFVGIGDQTNDGSDHRVVFHFDPLDALPPNATVELRVRVGSPQTALPSPVQLVTFDGIASSDRDAFTTPGTLIEGAWFDATTLNGHHIIDVSGLIDPATSTTFRLQLESKPPNNDGKTPLFVGTGDASRSVDRPALVVRSCG